PPLRVLRSFPTRRSSDLNGTLDACELGPWTVYNAGACDGSNAGGPDGAGGWDTNGFLDKFQVTAAGHGLFKSYHTEVAYQGSIRSEEHTSELQSRSDLVC